MLGSNMRRTWLLLSVALVGVGLLGVVPATAAPPPEIAAFCQAIVDTNEVFAVEEPTPKKANAALDAIEESAPAELADAVSLAVPAFRPPADPEQAFEDPAVGAAVVTIDQYVFDNCGYPGSEVTAIEYEFNGIPKTVKTGITLFKLTNEGAELHEMAIVRIKGDDKVKDLLKLSEKKLDKKIEFVGGTFAVQEESGVAYMDIKKPGRYLAVCFIPVGSVDPDVEIEDGKPHALEGMVQEFKVKKA